MQFCCRLFLISAFTLFFTCHQVIAASLSDAKSFCFAIGLQSLRNNAPFLTQCGIIVVDGELTTKRQVQMLKRNGSIVLAYLSVGTIEKNRFWFQQVKGFRLDFWEDWGEWYADTSKKKYRDVINNTVAAKFLTKGFDGLFLDNVDMISNHKRQRTGMRTLVRDLAKRVHRHKKFLFAQNGDDIIDPFIQYLDGWNREDVTSTYNFDTKSYEKISNVDTNSILATIAKLKTRGLVVTTTDYVKKGDFQAESNALQTACSAGALPFMSDIYLRRLPTKPYECSQSK